MIRFDRLQAGLVASVRAALPAATVVWAGQSIADGMAADTLCVLQIVTGFGQPEGGESRPTLTLPTQATLQVTGSCRAHVSGMWWEAADRDALLAALDAEPYLSATYAASGADSIVFDALTAGDLFALEANGLATWTTNATAQVEAQLEHVAGVCSVDVYSRSAAPRLGALAQASRWRTYARGIVGRELADRYGLTLAPATVLPLDAIAGERWDSRARVSVPISLTSLEATTAIAPIETALVGVELRNGDGDSVTANITIS